MPIKKHHKRLTAWIATFALVAGITLPGPGARAQDQVGRSVAAAWIEHDVVKNGAVIEGEARSRLIVAQKTVAPDDDRILIGWQVEFAPGWKTYWRAPGGPGQPPEIDWSASRNVKSLAIHWPVPKRVSLYGQDNFIYDGSLVLPMTVELAEKGEATEIVLTLRSMLCETVCAPLTVAYRIDLPQGPKPGETAEVAILADAMASLPKPVSDGIEISVVTENCRDHALYVVLADTKLLGPVRDMFVDLGSGRRAGPMQILDPTHFMLPIRGREVDWTGVPVHILLLGETGPHAYDGIPGILPPLKCSGEKSHP